MKLLDDYNRLQLELHDYFGYKEDWVPIPMEDHGGFFWLLDGEGHGGEVNYWEKDEDLATGDYYSGPIYTQKFLPKWVFHGEEHTMISLDTQTDGVKLLAIFDNAKERDQAYLDKNGLKFG